MFTDLSRRSILKLGAGTAGAAASGWLWNASAAQAAHSPTLNTGASLGSQALDTLVFGNLASETAHGLSGQFSDAVTGGLSQSARVLKPTDAGGFWGGTVSATLACRPEGETYVTIKLWGSDIGEDLGRIQLFVDGKQVGHMHLGAVDPLDIAGHDPRSAGRFYLHTLPLPANLTAGKTSVNLEIRSSGWIAVYAQNAADYYKPMTRPSRGVYRLYTHAEPFFDLAGDDVMGSMPAPQIRSSPGSEVLNKVNTAVIKQANSEANRTAPQLDLWFVEFLARAYSMDSTQAFNNAAVPGQIATSLDGIYWRYLADPKVMTDSNQQWMGLGRAGLVMLMLQDQLQPLYDLPVAGSPGVITNAGFEGGGTMPTGWRQLTFAGSGTATRDTVVKRSGSASAKLSVPASGTIALGPTDRTPIGAGTHTYAGWVKTEGVGNQGAYLDMLFFDATGKLVGGDNKFYATAGTSDWHQVTATLATPAGATRVEVQVRLSGAGTVWFDDLTLVVPEGSTVRPVIRREAWTKMLLDSREYWRQKFPQYTNQAMICAIGLYLANRGLQLLGSASAWDEAKARGYIYQSVGLTPWLGPETADGTPTKPLGSNYRQVSPKGISKELGYAGNYGELQDWLALMYDAVIEIGGMQDDVLRKHIITMAKARMVFRYPAVDNDGNKAVRYEALVGWRDAEYPGKVTYDEGSKWDGHALKLVSLLKDPELTSYARQSLDENQFFNVLDEAYKMGLQARTYLHLSSAAADYAYVSSAPDTGARMPMTTGQPDFVFSDEENGVVAIKNAGDIIFASLYWRARWGINRLARVHFITAEGIERSGTIWERVEYDPDGRTYTEPDWVNWEFGVGDLAIPGGGFSPPGPGLHQAFAGEPLPLAAAPADVPLQPLGKETPFAGRASFYQCQYGPFLIAMNTTSNKTYSFKPGEDFGESVDVASGKKIPAQRNMKVAPGTTVVLRRK